MIQIPVKRKYAPRGSNKAKKCGINGDHNNKARRRHHTPAPVSHQLTLVLIGGRKRVWEG